MELIYKGSVKDLYRQDNQLIFDYSNRYSIFDWGEMPDEIPQKGEALAAMAALFFEYLQSKGISSHYMKVAGKNRIQVQAVDVIRPEWKADHYDYSAYSLCPENCLVPLEVIFRRHLGQGNSLEGRLKKNPAYLMDLGLSEMPGATESFVPPLIEFSTKLETSDRYLTRAQISEMNVVSEKELQNIREQTQTLALELERLFASFGVKLWDGKVEFAFGKMKGGSRDLLLVDSIGPDELRLTYEGLPLSKEFLRQIYNGSAWAQAVKKAKDLASERKVQDWKSICMDELKQSPVPLNQKQMSVSVLLYQALANEVAKAMKRPTPFSEELNLKQWHKEALNLELGQ